MQNFKKALLLLISVLFLSFLLPAAAFAASPEQDGLNYMGLDFEALGFSEEEQEDMMSDGEVAEVMIEKGYAEAFDGKGMTDEEFVDKGEQFPVYTNKEGKVLLWSSADPALMDIVRATNGNIPECKDLQDGTLSLSINGHEVSSKMNYSFFADAWPWAAATGYAGLDPLDYKCTLFVNERHQVCYCESPYSNLPSSNSPGRYNPDVWTNDYWTENVYPIDAHTDGTPMGARIMLQATALYYGYAGKGYDDARELDQFTAGNVAYGYIATMKVVQYLHYNTDPNCQKNSDVLPASHWLLHNVVGSEYGGRRRTNGTFSEYIPTNSAWQTIINYQPGTDVPPPDTPPKWKYALLVQKKDSETQKPLAGAFFKLYDAPSGGNEVGSGSTDANGETLMGLGVLEPDGHVYYLEETEEPLGYTAPADLKSPNRRAVAITNGTADGRFGQDVVYVTHGVVNTPKKEAGIFIDKVDQNGNRLTDAELAAKDTYFEIQAIDGTVLCERLTLKDGYATWSLPEDKVSQYMRQPLRVIEHNPPFSDKLLQAFLTENLRENDFVGIASDGADNQHRLVNERETKPGYIKGFKYDANLAALGKDPHECGLPGAEFTLYKKDGTVAKLSDGSGDAKATTDANGEFVIGPVDAGVYDLKETKTPPVKDDPLISGSEGYLGEYKSLGTITDVTVEGGTTKASATVVPYDDPYGLPNYRRTVNEKYKVAVDKAFEAYEEGQLKDSGKQGGVQFELTKDGDLGFGTRKGKTDASGAYVFEDLPEGSYTLTERLDLLEDYTFESGETAPWESEGGITRHFTIPGESGEGVDWDESSGTLTFHFKNKATVNNVVPYYEYRLKKVDSETGEALSGATFSLYGPGDIEHERLTGVTSDANGYVTFSGLLTEGTYWWKEDSPPEGHTVQDSAKHQITINETNQNRTMNQDDPDLVKNDSILKKATLVVNKIDADDDGPTPKQPVENVEIQLWKGNPNAGGTYIESQWTDVNGEVQFNVEIPRYGNDDITYWVLEKRAPSEWLLDDPDNPRPVTVTYNTPTNSEIRNGLTFRNHRDWPQLYIKKTDPDGNGLARARYRIGKLAHDKTEYTGDADLDPTFGQSGWIGPYTTDSEGKLLVEEHLFPFWKDSQHRDGDRCYYVVEEWEAPPGYEEAWDPLVGYHSSMGGKGVGTTYEWPDDGHVHDDVNRQIVTLEWGKETTVTFKNYPLQNLDIMKVNFEGETPLPGVVFELWGTNHYQYLPNDSDLVGSKANGQVTSAFDELPDGRTVVTDDQGRAHFTGLHVGEYRLVEVRTSPDAGLRYLGQWKVVVTHSGVEITELGKDLPSKPVRQSYVDATTTWKIYNQAPPDIPVTGKIDSTLSVVLVGVVMVALAGAGYFAYSRKHKSLK